MLSESIQESCVIHSIYNHEQRHKLSIYSYFMQKVCYYSKVTAHLGDNLDAPEHLGQRLVLLPGRRGPRHPLVVHGRVVCHRLEDVRLEPLLDAARCAGRRERGGRRLRDWTLQQRHHVGLDLRNNRQGTASGTPT